MRSFRGLRYFLAPPWLTGRGDGEKIAFTLEWLLDAFLEKVRQGLNARFPSRAGASALNLIIGDRGLLRGRSESTASIVARLKAWRTPRTHRVRGNAYEALLQIWHYWGGTYAATVDAQGLRHVIEENDTPDVDTLAEPAYMPDWATGTPGSGLCVSNWDGANADNNWSRFWIILQPPSSMGIEAQPDFGDADLWGGALGTPGYTLGQLGVTPEDVSAMRALFSELNWHPAHAIPEWVVFSFDTGSPPAPAPDGEWLHWSKDSSGTRVAARSGSFRYWSLSPERNNTYGGIRSRPWPNEATLVDGSTYAGDRSNAAAWGAITLPNGETYTGTRGVFAARVLLLDDGSVPK